MQGPLISAIVPVYNGERYLEAALKSIFNQDYQPIEIIVVDDGSTDRTAEIIRSHQNIRYIYQTNQGPSAARNSGIAVAQGEFIAFLDADDMWMPQKLSLQFNYLTQHPDVELVFSHRQMIIEKEVAKPSWYLEGDTPGLFASNLLARKNIFQKAGFFNPEYRFGENAEWLARVKEAGITMAVLPETLLIYRVHDQNLTQHHLDEMRHDVLRALKSSINRQRNKNQTRKSTFLDEKKAGISVIIPVYNGEQYLAETINGVLAQTYEPFEVIIVDDGSTDGTADIARSHEEIRYIYQTNQGLGAARNAGIGAAEGDFIAFLDADDLWTEKKNEVQMRVFNANPQADIVTGHLKQFYSPELGESERKKIRCTDELLPGYILSAMLIKREAFSRVGLFETQWVVGTDMSWYLRALEKKVCIITLPDLVLLRRLHKHNKGITQRSFINQRVQILKAALDRQRGKKDD